MPFTQYKDKEDIQREIDEEEQKREFVTGIVLVLSKNGDVLINRNPDIFKNRISREATESDCLYMLQNGADQIKFDRAMKVAMRAFEKVLEEVSSRNIGDGKNAI